MELMDRERKYYGVPATLDAKEPHAVVVCVWQSDIKDRTHTFHVRQQVVSRSSQTKAGAGGKYRLCYFGHREQWVNEENIRAHRSTDRAPV